MSKKDCIWVPTVKIGNEEHPSKLYKDLYNKFQDRGTALYAYIAYKQPSVGNAMDNAGYTRDAVNEHNAEDVLDYLKAIKIFSSTADTKELVAVANGVAILGIPIKQIDFASGLEALDKVIQINTNTKGAFVSRVVKTGKYFNVEVANKSAKTAQYLTELQELQQSWDFIEKQLKKLNSSIILKALEKLMPVTFDILNPSGFITYLNSLAAMNPRYFTKNDILTILVLGLLYAPVDTIINNLINRVKGRNQNLTTITMEDVASDIYSVYHTLNISSTQPGLVLHYDTSLRELQKRVLIQALDVSNIASDLNLLLNNFRLNNSIEYDIQTELAQIRKSNNIDAEIIRTKNTIDSYQDIVTEEIFSLERLLRAILEKLGNNQTTADISNIIQTLFDELKAKEFKSGSLEFINLGMKQLKILDKELSKITNINLQDFDGLRDVCNLLSQIYNFSAAYKRTIEAILHIDDKTANLTLLDTDKLLLVAAAEQFNTLLDKWVGEDNTPTKRIRLEVAWGLCKEVLGDKASSIIGIQNIEEMMSADGSILDYLYAVGRQSSPLISVWGSILLDAHDRQEKQFIEVCRKIRGNRNALKKGGSTDDSFMYDDNDYIKSDIDWHAYSSARKAAYFLLKNSGLLGVPLLLKLQEWEDQNLEDRVVYDDGTALYIERVPNGSYRLDNGFTWDGRKMIIDKDKTGWTLEQIDYYNNMMEIKGYLLSKSPNYAQHLYRPPYLRKSSLDAITDIGKYGWKKTLVTLSKRVIDAVKVKEDDDLYAKNGMIFNEDEGVIARSNYDNTLVRKVPIFYRQKIKTRKLWGVSGQDEILHDFATSLQHYAATILGYSEIMRVKDVLELFANFIASKDVVARKNNYDILDLIENKDTFLIKRVAKRGQTMASKLIEEFVDRDIYGEKIIPIMGSERGDKFLRGLASYTGLKLLAVNAKGGTANWLLGEILLIIEAAAQERFGWKDWVRGLEECFKQIGSLFGFTKDALTHNRNTDASLLMEFFDPTIDNMNELWHHRYHSNYFRTVLGLINPYFIYATGEYKIHVPTMYAILNNLKVLLNGEKTPLLDVFTYNDGPNNTRYLGIKDNVTTLTGEPIDINSEYLIRVKKLIKETNLNMHGSMSDYDKGLIHRYTLGKLFMSLRLWMVEHYSRRYRGKHLSADTKDLEMGYNRTFYKYLLDKVIHFLTVLLALFRDYTTAENILLQDIMRWNAPKNKDPKHYKIMSNKEKANIKRASAELAMYGTLLALGIVLGDPKDHKKEWLRRFLIYEQKRLLSEVLGSLIFGMPIEFKNITKSPFSVIPTMSSLIYPFAGIFNGDLTERILRGEDEGEIKYVRNVKKYSFPFIYQIESLLRLDEDDAQFSIFGDDRKWSN